MTEVRLGFSLRRLFLCRCLFHFHRPAKSRGLHPAYGRLGPYRVSIPLDWEVTHSHQACAESRERSYVRSHHWKGTLRSGIDEFIGRQPSLTSSYLGCDSSPLQADQTSFANPDRDRLIATRHFPLGKVALTCGEYVSRDSCSARESRTVWRERRARFRLWTLRR